jgi:hypothetical protein
MSFSVDVSVLLTYQHVDAIPGGDQPQIFPQVIDRGRF